MILEEIEGNVKVTYDGKALSIGDSADDYSKAVLVIGSGKAVFRVDPSCTFDVKGVEVVAEEKPEAPVVEKPVVKAAAKAAPEPTPAPEAPAAE